jgi:hypothetical protein
LSYSVPRSPEQQAALHDFALALARRPEIAAFAGALVETASGRVSRIAALFNFVSLLTAASSPLDGRPRDGVDAILELIGEVEGRAVVLSALLQAIGERARVDGAGEGLYVRVALEPDDLGRLPPHARLIRGRDRIYLPLDPRPCGRPFGLPPTPAKRPLGNG